MIDIVPKIKGFEFDIDVEFYRQGEFIVAYSPDLDLSTYSKTLERAKSAFEDALNVFMTETLEKGTFFSELESLGWKIKLVPTPEFLKPKKRSNPTSHNEVIDHTQIPVRIPIRA
jgi:hypothetical protein